MSGTSRRADATTECALCGDVASLLYEGLPGYQIPLAYDVYDCRSCGTRFVLPLEVVPEVYDAIYTQALSLPGYDRYAQYAEDVLEERQPLDYLASVDDNYWALRSLLVSSSVRPACRVLEVGCGLGYLTYALVRAGYDTMGMDISEHAVRKARGRYGMHFVHEDFIAHARENKSRYDAVVMLEVVEHVPNVRELVAAAKEALVPGGSLLLTTPNKTFFSDRTLWETEAPPVHLWWFSEGSIRHLAGELGFSVTFTDFTALNKLSYRGAPKIDVLAPSKAPILDEQGRSLAVQRPAPSWKKAIKKLLPGVATTLLKAPRAAAGYARFCRERDFEARRRRPVIGASLRKLG